VYDRPISSGTRQEVAYCLFPHWMHGGNTQKVFFDVARKGEIIAFVSNQIFFAPLTKNYFMRDP